MKEISANKLYNILQDSDQDNYLVVDVRTPGEYKSEHIVGVANIPLDKIGEHHDELEKYDTVYVHCNTGNRSEKACVRLDDLGLDNIVNVSGGLEDWQEQGFSVVKGDGVAIPLMRQVQIAAGGLVLIGVSLGWFVHPGWYGLSAFVGAGLTFAGLTGTCMMARLLGKMPWNN
jgi:rhodanese-related sulfurtransferase